MNNYIFNYRQYKKSINHKNNFLPIIVSIILLLGLCIYLYPNKTNNEKFYFVEIDCFNTYNLANELALNINSSGGAGYVFFDGNYHVFASFYSSLSSAESVVKNLKSDYKNASVYTLETKKIACKNLSNQQSNVIENLFKETTKILIKFEELNKEYNLKKISNEELKLHIKNHQKTFDDLVSDFNSVFSYDSKYNLAKEHLIDMQNCFTTLTESETILSSTLRYQNIKLAVLSHQFLSCF